MSAEHRSEEIFPDQGLGGDPAGWCFAVAGFPGTIGTLSLSPSTSALLHPMQIGACRLENNLWLAPMAGITDRPFRQLCRRLGAGMAMGEMLTADTGLWERPKSLQRLDHQGETSPIGVQLVGADPEKLAEAARISEDRGAQMIDINLGCPAKKVCRREAGSALLREPKLVQRLLEAVVAAVRVPVTLKMRTGWSPEERNGVAIASMAEQIGIQAVTVHGRTRACGFAGEAEYDTITAIKARLRIPVIANGDIGSPERARLVLERTGADGIMIGRGALGRPWLFREIGHFLATGSPVPPPEPAWIARLMQEHLGALYEFYGERRGVRIARKHIGWYSRHFPDGDRMRDHINLEGTALGQIQALAGFLNKTTTTTPRKPIA